MLSATLLRFSLLFVLPLCIYCQRDFVGLQNSGTRSHRVHPPRVHGVAQENGGQPVKIPDGSLAVSAGEDRSVEASAAARRPFDAAVSSDEKLPVQSGETETVQFGETGVEREVSGEVHPSDEEIGRFNGFNVQAAAPSENVAQGGPRELVPFNSAPAPALPALAAPAPVFPAAPAPAGFFAAPAPAGPAAPAPAFPVAPSIPLAPAPPPLPTWAPVIQLLLSTLAPPQTVATPAPAFTLPTFPTLFPTIPPFTLPGETAVPTAPTTPYIPQGLYGYPTVPGQDFDGVGVRNPDGLIWYVHCRKNCGRGRKRK